MSPALKVEMNLIIKRFKSVMFLFLNNKVYLLHHHYRHLDPEDAVKLYIGRGAPPKHPDVRQSNRHTHGKIIYIYKPL